jgi:ribosomal protein S17E
MGHLETNKLVMLARSDDFADKLTKIFEENKRKQQSVKKAWQQDNVSTFEAYCKS